jgi:hypothetical protein
MLAEQRRARCLRRVAVICNGRADTKRPRHRMINLDKRVARPQM